MIKERTGRGKYKEKVWDMMKERMGKKQKLAKGRGRDEGEYFKTTKIKEEVGKVRLDKGRNDAGDRTFEA